MHFSFRRQLLFVGLLLFCPVLHGAWVENVWPFAVMEKDDISEEFQRLTVGGLIYSQTYDWPVKKHTIRPIYSQFYNQETESRDHYYFYPIFRRHTTPNGVRWSFFNLIQGQTEGYQGSRQKKRFRIFPLYSFDSDPESKETPGHSIFPVAGRLEHFFGADHVSWVLFPLWAEAQTGEDKKYYALWPIFRFQKGPLSSGGAVWPLFGALHKAGKYDRYFIMWPLFYRQHLHLERDIPTFRQGLLPVFSYEKSRDLESLTWFWPFFGFTEEYEPKYKEYRFFWPLLVQGRGEEKFKNRFAPIYSHSYFKDKHKWWFMWPSVKIQEWEEKELLIQQKQFMYSLVWSQTQRRVGDENSPVANKHHVWPLFSAWDNGAGEKQFQVFSPFEPFFPHNKVVRELYTPLFALYRYYQRAPGWSYYSLFFQLITLQKSPDQMQLTIGPVLSVEGGEKSSGFEILKGLLGYKREGDKKIFKFFWFKV